MSSEETKNNDTNAYHKECIELQRKFIADVKSLLNVIKWKSYNFLDNRKILNRINTPYVMDLKVITSPRNMEPHGISLNAALVENRIIKCLLSLTSTPNSYDSINKFMSHEDTWLPHHSHAMVL